MERRRAFLAIALMMVGPGVASLKADAAPGAPFACAVSTVFIAQGSPTQMYALTYGNGGNTFTEVGPRSTYQYNAMAFRKADGFIYAITLSGRVLRIDSDGLVTDLGPTSPALPTTPSINSGAFDGLGNYWVMSSDSNRLHKIDLGTTPPARTASTLTGASVFPADMSFVGARAWGYRGGKLYRIDPSTATVAAFTQSALQASDAGAAWTYGNGNLGLSINATGDIYQVKITDPDGPSPSFTKVSQAAGPSSSSNDGTSCVGAPADLSITKAVPSRVSPGAEITWTITVHNNGSGASSGYVVTDDVPASVGGVATIAPTDANCVVAGNRVECTGGPMDVGDEDVITIRGTAPGATGVTVTNSATVVGNEVDPVLENDTAEATTRVEYPPGRCHASALDAGGVKVGSANAQDTPCMADTDSLHEETRTVGDSATGATVSVAAASAMTDGGPGRASAEARLAYAEVTVGGTTLRIDGAQSAASASFAPGCVRSASGSSSIATLAINGMETPVGSDPRIIPLPVGMLYLNQTVPGEGMVVQRALFLDLEGATPDVVIGEASAGVVC